ncbi:hypothetical protein P5V15_009667 [Pogonomyrmex californicus]
MFKFTISAPMTIFLNGDAILEYNGPCVTAALNHRVYVEFSSLPLDIALERYIRIIFKSLKFYLNIPLYAFFEHFYEQNVIREFSEEDLINEITVFLGSLNIKYSIFDSMKEAQYLSLQAFLYLLLFMARKENITITTTIAVQIWSDSHIIGKGLGSSASFVTCLAACFWRWSLLQKGIIKNVNKEFIDNDYTQIEFYALSCEKIIFNCQNRIKLLTSINGSIMTFDNAIELSNRPFKIHKVLINMNQDLLKTLGLSNQYIDFICTTVQKYYSCGCKMTGTNGYVFILSLPNTKISDIEKLKDELISHNFPAFITGISPEGIRIW